MFKATITPAEISARPRVFFFKTKTAALIGAVRFIVQVQRTYGHLGKIVSRETVTGDSLVFAQHPEKGEIPLMLVEFVAVPEEDLPNGVPDMA
jgi:hypothetical protein